MEKKKLKFEFEEFGKPDYEAWKDAAIKTLKGAPFEKKLISKTYEGIDLQPIYNKEDIDEPESKNTFPGFYPFIRGKDAANEKFPPWEINVFRPYRDPALINAGRPGNIYEGVDSVSFRIDDDHTVVNSIADFQKSFHGFEEKDISFHLETSEHFMAAAASLQSLFPAKKLKGSIGADMISELIFSGTVNFDIDKYFKSLAEFINWTEENDHDLKTVVISSIPWFEAGAHAAQELALMLASGVYHIEKISETGIKPEVTAKRMKFNMAAGGNFFMEIAKFRAARMLWARIMREFTDDKEAEKMIIHAFTPQRNKSKLDPHTNMLRTTSETLAAVLGQCEVITTSPFDDIINKPTEFTGRIAKNIQLILREESHLNKPMDPAGGSYYIEALTIDLAKKSWDLFRKIDETGGILEALKEGIPQSEIENTLDERVKNLRTRKDVIVGANQYPNMDEKDIDQADTESDFQPLNPVPKDNLAQLLEELKNSDNALIDNVQKCLESGASFTQIFNSLYPEIETGIKIKTVKKFRFAEMFEELRNKSKILSEKGKSPKVYLANFGKVNQYKARADFSGDFFHVGGFETEVSPAFVTAAEGAKAFLNTGVNIVVICSGDDLYPEFVPDFAKMVKKEKPDAKIILAGYPKEHIEEFKTAGVDEFIHVKADIYAILSKILKDLEK